MCKERRSHQPPKKSIAELDRLIISFYEEMGAIRNGSDSATVIPETVNPQTKEVIVKIQTDAERQALDELAKERGTINAGTSRSGIESFLNR
jgi:hypothetical protein